MPSFECPTCKTNFDAAHLADLPHRPFCSERCKMIDLGRWLDGFYTLSEPLSEDDLAQGDTGQDSSAQ